MSFSWNKTDFTSNSVPSSLQDVKHVSSSVCIPPDQHRLPHWTMVHTLQQSSFVHLFMFLVQDSAITVLERWASWLCTVRGTGQRPTQAAAQHPIHAMSIMGDSHATNWAQIYNCSCSSGMTLPTWWNTPLTPRTSLPTFIPKLQVETGPRAREGGPCENHTIRTPQSLNTHSVILQ